MDQPADLIAQDAAEALIALGWPVTPYGPDMDRWQIGDFILTDADLMALAGRPRRLSLSELTVSRPRERPGPIMTSLPKSRHNSITYRHATGISGCFSGVMCAAACVGVPRMETKPRKLPRQATAIWPSRWPLVFG